MRQASNDPYSYSASFAQHGEMTPKVLVPSDSVVFDWIKHSMPFPLPRGGSLISSCVLSYIYIVQNDTGRALFVL